MPKRKMMDVNSIINKYSLSARAEGLSEKTVEHTVNSVNISRADLSHADFAGTTKLASGVRL